MVPDEEQQVIIQKICELYQGGTKISAIAPKLNQDSDNKVLGR